MSYIEKKGNIFNSKAMTIVNTVNCVGAMGKGIALEYKLRFPEMFKEYQHFYPPAEFVMEFGTVSLDIGRGVGKSKFIRENAKPNDLVLVHNLEEVRYWEHYRPMTKVVCSRIHNAQYIKKYGQRFDTIWVDEPRLVFESVSRYDMMKHLIVDYGQTVVMLGRCGE